MSLKSKFKQHIINKLITDTIEQVSNDGEITSFLLILDDESARILNSCFTMSELINCRLFSIELITKKRKPYRSMHAIYFITHNSIEYLINDFEKSNLYKRAHIFFTDRLTDYDMNKLVIQNLVSRTLTLKESNANFYIYDKNIFYLNPISSNQNLLSYIYPSQSDIHEELIKTVCEKITSVCIVMNQFPNIAFYKGDKVCRSIALNVDKELKIFYDTNKTSPNKNSLLFISSRLLDLCGPLTFDLSYQSLIFDLIDKSTCNSVRVEGKDHVLDEKDELYTKYKNFDIDEANTKIQQERTEYKNLYDARKKNNNTFEEMASNVRSMAEIERMGALHVFHSVLLNQIHKEFQNGLSNIIDIQTSIISGYSQSEKKLDYKNISSELKNLPSGIDTNTIVRLLSCIHYYYDLSKENLKNVINKIEVINSIAEEKMKIIEYFTKQNSISKEEDDALNKEIMVYRTQNMASKKYEKDKRFLCLKESKLATLVDMCSNFVLPKNSFEYLHEVKPKKKAKVISFDGMEDEQNETENKNYLFLFILGGISHYEISTIEKISKSLEYQVVIGSNAVYNADEYLRQVNDYVNGKCKVFTIQNDNKSGNSSNVRIDNSRIGPQSQLINNDS